MEKLLESAFSFVPRMTNVKGLRAILHRWCKEVRNLQGLVYIFLFYTVWGFIFLTIFQYLQFYLLKCLHSQKCKKKKSFWEMKLIKKTYVAVNIYIKIQFKMLNFVWYRSNWKYNYEILGKKKR